jgi:hypothetical protein
MTETLIIVISILFLGVCLSSSRILYDSYKKLKSIEVDLMGIETRQRNTTYNQEVMEMKIDYISSLLEEIEETFEETLTNENKEKEKR